MSDDHRWVRKWYSNYIELQYGHFAEEFNSNYEMCKEMLRYCAKKEGIDPDLLEYSIEAEENRWDFRFVVTGTVRG